MSPVNLAKIARRTSRRGPAAAVLVVTCLWTAGGPGLAQPKASIAEGPSRIATTTDLTADQECLTIVQSSASTYTISNSVCAEQSVLAAIELAGAGNSARCFVKKIRTQISIASEGSAPIINYQCVEGTSGCSAEIVRDMFPECHAG